MSGLNLIVFDCDGTLVDSQAAIIHAMREAFVAAEMAVPSDEAIRALWVSRFRKPSMRSRRKQMGRR